MGDPFDPTDDTQPGSSCFLPVAQSLARKLERVDSTSTSHTPSEPSDDLSDRRYSDISAGATLPFTTSDHISTSIPRRIRASTHLSLRASLPPERRHHHHHKQQKQQHHHHSHLSIDPIHSIDPISSRPPASLSSPRLDFTAAPRPPPSLTASASTATLTLTPDPSCSPPALRPRPVRAPATSSPPPPTTTLPPPTTTRRRLSALWTRLRGGGRTRPRATRSSIMTNLTNTTTPSTPTTPTTITAHVDNHTGWPKRDWAESFRMRRRSTRDDEDDRAALNARRNGLPPRTVTAHPPAPPVKVVAARAAGRRARSATTSVSSSATADASALVGTAMTTTMTTTTTTTTTTSSPPPMMKATPSAASRGTKGKNGEDGGDRAGTPTGMDETSFRTLPYIAAGRHCVYADAKEPNSFAGFRGRFVFTTDGSSVSSSSDREEDVLNHSPESHHLYLSRRQLRAMHYK